MKLNLKKYMKLTLKLEDQVNQPGFLIEYFSGIKTVISMKNLSEGSIQIGRFKDRLTVDLFWGH